MIDGTRRGYLIGCEIGRILIHVSDEELEKLARWHYTWLQSIGVAHIAPVEGFVTSFIDGFHSAHVSLAGKRAS